MSYLIVKYNIFHSRLNNEKCSVVISAFALFLIRTQDEHRNLQKQEPEMNHRNTLYNRAIDPETLHTAWLSIKHKAAHSPYYSDAIYEFSASARQRLDQLHYDLQNDHYLPEPLQVMQIGKKSRTSTRSLRLPALSDKIVQEAVRSVIAPVIDKRLSANCYAYRKGKGIYGAVKKVSSILQANNHHWVVHADIDNFFDNIQRDLLLKQLTSLVSDTMLVRLIRLWLETGGYDRKGNWQERSAGISQGSGLSPCLANLYLTPLDRFLDKQDIIWIRYADDVLMLTRTRSQGQLALKNVINFLSSTLNLSLNTNPRPVVGASSGFVFLGITFDKRQRRISARSLENISTRLHTIAHSPYPVLDKLEQISSSIQSIARHYKGLVNKASMHDIEQYIQDSVLHLCHELWHNPIAGTQKQTCRLLKPFCLSVLQTMPHSDSSLREILSQARNLESPRPSDSPKKSRHRYRAQGSVSRKTQKSRQLFYSQRYDEGHLTFDVPGSFIGVKGGNLYVRHKRRMISEHTVDSIHSVTIRCKSIALSTDVLSVSSDNNIPVIFCDSLDRPVSQLTTCGLSGNDQVLAQVTLVASDDPMLYRLARQLVLGKLVNQHHFIQRLKRYHGKRANTAEIINTGVADLKTHICDVKAIEIVEFNRFRNLLMAAEGRAACVYWRVIGQILKPYLDFPGRKKPNAQDIFNCLLNYGYRILQTHVHTAVVCAGLSPQIGVLHTNRARLKQPALVYDLMEQFRAALIDRSALSCITCGEIADSDVVDGKLTPTARERLRHRIHINFSRPYKINTRSLTTYQAISHYVRDFGSCLVNHNAYRYFKFNW